MGNFVAHIVNLGAIRPRHWLHVMLGQPRLEQVAQGVVLVPNQKVKSNEPARRRQHGHVVVHRRRPRVQIDVLAHHGLPHIARPHHDIGNLQWPHRLNRHVVTIGLPLVVLEKDAGHLHRHEFPPQRSQLGVVVLQGTSVHLFGVREPLGKVGIDVVGVLVPRIDIGALRGGLEAGILPPRSDRGLGDQFDRARARRQGRNQARLPCEGVRREENGRVNHAGLLPLPLVPGNHKVGTRHIPDPVPLRRHLEREGIPAQLGLELERRLDVNRQQTNPVRQHFIRHRSRIGYHLDVRGRPGRRHVCPKSHHLNARHDEAA